MPAPSASSPGMGSGPLLSQEGYRTAPDHNTTGWPPGIPYIVGNEVCERFSYYGMRAILYVQLAALYVLAGQVEETAKDLATSTMHLFMAGVYALPMIGAILADRLLGKFRTILWVSLLYCGGHAVLACVDTVTTPAHKLNVMYLGLALIAIGSGGIKPCVSANVGDQFGKGNWSKVRTVFQIFYFSVNFGSFFATLLIPWVKEAYGAGVAFAIPGILMGLATLIFWLGRKQFVHVPPRPGGTIGLLDTLSSVALFLTVGHFFLAREYTRWLEQTGWFDPDYIPAAMGAISFFFLALGLGLFAWRQRLEPSSGFLAVTFHALANLGRGTHLREEAGPDAPRLARSAFWAPAVERFGLEATEGPVAVLKVVSILFLISVFWALFDQHSSSWIRQAELMDRQLPGGATAKPSQIPALNPLMVMILIPVLGLVYHLCDKVGLRATPLRRITVGMFIAALSFVNVALLQERIDTAGVGKVWFGWQFFPYLLITTAEVMVAVTALEFSYTQAPRAMKSTVMAFLNLTVSLGNVLVAVLALYTDGLSELFKQFTDAVGWDRSYAVARTSNLADFFWVFALLMAAAAVLFGLRSLVYVQKDYPQR